MTDHEDSTPPQALFQRERHQEILSLTHESGRVEVADLSARFNVTGETIRRDLSELQELRLVRRVHGGAVAWEMNHFEPLVAVRKDLSDEEKRRIAKLAINELPDTGSVIIDSGTTLTRFAEAIPADNSLRVVTNSLVTAQVLAEHEDMEVIVVGGKVRSNTMAMVDAAAIESLEPLRVDTLFVSSDGLSPEQALTTPYRQEALLKEAMIRSARRVVALVDHSKFGQEHFIRFAEWSDIDVLITNAEANATAIAKIEALGTTVLLA